MRHAAYSHAASHARPSASAQAAASNAWAANPLPAASAPSSAAYPPLGAAPPHQPPPHQQHHHHPHPQDSAAVQSVSTLLDRVLAMLDGFEDDMDCPLCLEEMDLSDLNFRPCPCGYQICRFCYHHIKENLNNKCPACRTPYDDATVEFKAIKPEEMKRLQAAKKLRDKRRKDSELAMQNKANVRVRQRTQVHITGMTTRQANEDTLAQLKDADHFGKYGKITRLFMSKRSPTSGSAPGSSHPVYQPVNVYVCYRTPTEASHCIAATDGTLSVEGNKLRAVWGTTRYCPNYLKGIRCPDYNCTFAHEPGEEIEGPLPSTKDEIFTYDSETVAKPKAAAPAAVKKQPEVSLPASASWASKNAPPQPTTPIILNPHLPPLSATLPKPPPPRMSVPKPQNHPLPARPSSRAKQAAAAAAAATAASTSASGSNAPPAPASPAVSAAQPSTPAEEAKEEVQLDAEEVPEEPVASTSRSPSPRPVTPPVQASPAPYDPFAALSAQYTNGFAAPGFDVPSFPSFPDLEFGGESAFSFNLDVKGKGRAAPAAPADEPTPFRDFANLESFGRPAEPPAAAASASYMGSFDPFAENAFSGSSALGGSNDLRSASPSPPSTGDDLSRRSSRFGFARRASSSAGAKGAELLSLAARSAFGGLGGRDGSPGGLASPGAPFAPPGIGLPQRANSGFGGVPPEWGAGGGTPGMAPAFPPGVLRSLASPSASTTSSPQLSPRTRASLPHGHGHAHGGYAPPPPPGLGAPPLGLNGVANSALPPPPGLMPGRGAPIPAASFPLPPPAPRAAGSTVAKEDLLALIAAAQASAPKQQQAMQAPSQDPHPFFSDPAILNARLASGPADQQLPPPQQQQHQGGMPQYAQQQSPFPPGMRLPYGLQQQQPQQQQQQGMYRQMGGQPGKV
ncbi:transcriptional repressor proteinral negative regulator of transcription subunit 4 [Rhodotorula kratochvilovae]